MARINGFTPEQISEARMWALRYESSGYQVLPSASDRKKPLVSYARHWEGGLPPVHELWGKFPSGNIQVMTGSRWNLCAIDCDGADGIRTFREWLDAHRVSSLRTWISSSDDREGLHYWFRLPRNLIGRSFPKRLLWGVWEPEANDGKGGWRNRSAVEFFCDHSLIMAPPSVHPKTGRKYRWHRGCDPLRLAAPAVIPDWLLSMSDIRESHQPRKNEQIVRSHASPSAVPVDLPCRPSEVLSAIHDKESLAVSWGLRVHSRIANAEGWKRVHAIDREDRDPSASFNPSTGRYWEEKFNGGRSICLFRFAVELGIYATWREACVSLAQQYVTNVFHRRKVKDVG